MSNELAPEQSARVESILALEEALSAIPGAKFGDSDLCPLKHHFAPGVYLREILLPKGVVLTGKIHLHEHFCIMVSGHVLLVDENDSLELEGYHLFISRPRTKRAIHALQDTIFLTIHENHDNTRDMEILEKRCVVNTYAEYDRRLPAEKKLRLCEVVP